MCLISVRGNLSPLLEPPSPFSSYSSNSAVFLSFPYQESQDLKGGENFNRRDEWSTMVPPPQAFMFVRKRMKGQGGGAKFAREENFSCVLVGKKSSGAAKEGEWKRSGMLEKHGGWDAALLL